MTSVLLHIAHFAIFALIWLAALVLAQVKLDDWGVAWVMVIGYVAGRAGWAIASYFVPGVA